MFAINILFAKDIMHRASQNVLKTVPNPKYAALLKNSGVALCVFAYIAPKNKAYTISIIPSSVMSMNNAVMNMKTKNIMKSISIVYFTSVIDFIDLTSKGYMFTFIPALFRSKRTKAMMPTRAITPHVATVVASQVVVLVAKNWVNATPPKIATNNISTATLTTDIYISLPL
ncbi:MAG: hypothetical protein PHQ22_10535 [Sulfuricurvum sp.]|nr:hypothetical protein [Sulfuricurvum sp.]